MSLDLSELNESQLEAVNWNKGPLLVLAGPGSGKTKVLTTRISRILNESLTSRFKILGVTFTNKAALEMRNRVDSLVVDGRHRAVLTTFHALAVDVLRQHGSHAGLRPDFALLTELSDREAVLTDALRTASFDRSEFSPRASQILPVISRMLDECVGPEQARAKLGNQPYADALAAIYCEYRRQLLEANQLDFASLLSIVVELLESKPSISRQLQKVYSHVCVDEFQDTNAAQFRLLLQLIPLSNPNLFVVADDDQLIYQWNGANPARLEQLINSYSMQILQLPENYRCPSPVIDLANQLIAHNSGRSLIKLPLASHKPRSIDNCVSVKQFTDIDSEAIWISTRIKNLEVEEISHCVILARNRKMLESIALILNDQGVPAHIPIRRNEFQSAPFRWMHAVLRLANLPMDREQLRRVASSFSQLCGINILAEDAIARSALEQKGYLNAWISLVEERGSFSSEDLRVISTIKHSLLERLDLWPFVRESQRWFDIISSKAVPLTDLVDPFVDYADEKQIWESLESEIAKHFSRDELSLHSFLQELDLRAKEMPAPKNAVVCLTIAASKGMEFRHVFLVGLVEDELPSFYAKKKGDDSEELREERRNCFVAITRTEETLSLTYSDYYNNWRKQPSRFLGEMGLFVD